MNIKSLNQVRLTLASAVLFSSAALSAAPMVAIGDDAALFINSSAGVEYNSNTFRTTTNRQSDTALVITPGVEMTYGAMGAPAYATLTAGWEFRRHDKFSDLNGDYARINFDTAYDSGVTLFSGHASFNQYGVSSRSLSSLQIGADLVPVPVDRNVGRANGYVRHTISDTLGLGGGLAFIGRTYKNTPTGRSLTNYDTWEVPLRVYYNVAPRLDAVAGYRLREVRIGDTPVGQVAPNYRDHYVFVGLDGEIFNPLWQASVDVGYQERKYRSTARDSINSLSANAQLQYNADANRSYFIQASRDFEVSPVGASVYTRTQLTIGGTFRVNEMWSFIGAGSYAFTRYEDSNRREDLFLLLAGVTYSPNEYVSINANVRFTDVDGRGANATDFRNEFLSLSASVRY